MRASESFCSWVPSLCGTDKVNSGIKTSMFRGRGPDRICSNCGVTLVIAIVAQNGYHDGMKILAIISGEYGLRHVNHLRSHLPPDWSIEVWKAPAAFPLIIDYPEDYLPARFSPADLILSFAETKAMAE